MEPLENEAARLWAGVPPNGGPNRNNVTLVAFLACSVVKESRNLRHGSWLAILCDGLNGLPYPLRCASPFLLGVVPFHVHVVTGSTPGGAGTHTQIHVDTHEPHEPTSKPAPPTDSRARPCQPRNARFTQTADTCHHSPDQARRWSTVPYRFKNTGGSRDTQDRQVPSPRCLFTGTVP